MTTPDNCLPATERDRIDRILTDQTIRLRLSDAQALHKLASRTFREMMTARTAVRAEALDALKKAIREDGPIDLNAMAASRLVSLAMLAVERHLGSCSPEDRAAVDRIGDDLRKMVPASP